MTRFRRSIAGFGVAVTLAAFAVPAQAQFSFGVAGGVTTASGSINDREDMGYNGLVVVQAGFPLIPFKLRADVQYNSFGATSIATGSDDARVISGSLNAVFNLLPGPVKPYLIGGVGYYDTGFSSSANSRKTGYSYGVGVKVTKLFVEARLHNIRNGAFDVGNGRTTSKFIPISAGFMF